MSFGAIAIGVGAAVAGTAGYLSAKSAQSAASDTNSRELQQQRLQNEFNERMYDKSRESTLSTQYSGLEDTFSKDIASIYNSVQAQNRGNLTAQTYDDLSSALSGSTASINALMSGLTYEQQQALLGGVQAARTGGAQSINQTALQGVADTSAARLAGVRGTNAANVAGINTALQQTLGGLKAQQAAAGLSGGSSFASNLAAGSTISARQQAASDLAKTLGDARLTNAADLAKARDAAATLSATVGEQNASDAYSLYNQNLATRLANLNSAYGMVGNAAQAQSLLSASDYADVQALTNLLSYANMGQGQLVRSTDADYTSPKSINPAASALSGVASVLGSYGKYAAGGAASSASPSWSGDMIGGYTWGS